MKTAHRLGRRSAAFLLTGIVVLQAACASAPASAPLPVASGPDCSVDLAPLLSLGCANRANLAAMVADPADLKEGRALTAASGTREARAVDAYNKGQVKNLGEGAPVPDVDNAPPSGTGDK